MYSSSEISLNSPTSVNEIEKDIVQTVESPENTIRSQSYPDSILHENIYTPHNHLPQQAIAHSHSYNRATSENNNSTSHTTSISPLNKFHINSTLAQELRAYARSDETTDPFGMDGERATSDNNESPYQPPSSTESEQDDNEEILYAAKTIGTFLMNDWKGCGEEKHTERYTQHLVRDSNNHHHISETYKDFEPPHLTSEQYYNNEDIGLTAPGLAKPQNMPCSAYISSEALTENFHAPYNRSAPQLQTQQQEKGEEANSLLISTLSQTPTSADKEFNHETTNKQQSIPSDIRVCEEKNSFPYERKQICLHLDDLTETQSVRVFDGDSMILTLRSLEAIQTTLRFCPSKNTAPNITSDLHFNLRVPIYNEDGEIEHQFLEPRHIPMLFLGQIDGSIPRMNVFLCSPRMYKKDRQTNFFTDEQVQLFMDIAMLPACKSVIPADQYQYWPKSFRQAEMRSKVKMNSRSKHPTFPISSHELQTIWPNIQTAIHDPQNAMEDFRDSFIIFNAIGIKLDCKVDNSLLNTMNELEHKLRSMVDISMAEEVFIDIAAESAPTNDNITHLWKRCCLESFYKQVKTKWFDKKQGVHTLFNLGMLQDAANSTLIPPKGSRIFQGGLRYVQHYAAAHSIVDAQSVYPFQDHRLSELAVDPTVWLAANASMKTTNVPNRSKIIDTYAEDKKRVYKSYVDNQYEKFAARFEVRITWTLFQAVQKWASGRDATRMEQGLKQPRTRPQSLLSIPTQTWANFMLGNYHRITSTIELCSITSPPTGISIDRSRLMAILLLYLRQFSNCHLDRFSLFCGTRGDQDRWNLGLKANMEAFGFGWFGAAVDWEKLMFTEPSATGLREIDHILLGRLGRFGHVVEDISSIVDYCMSRLGSIDEERISEKAWLVMAHCCLRQYRRDVIDTLQLRDHVRKVLVDGERLQDSDVRFSAQGIKEVWKTNPNFVSGNRGAKSYHPQVIFDYLFTNIEGDGIGSRKGFKNLPYRVIFNRVETFLSHKSITGNQSWPGLVRQILEKYHWVVLYPNKTTGGFSVKNKSSERSWWAGRFDNNGAWVWGGKNPQSGYPPAYPDIASMRREDVEIYLR